jgi:hypothetical protein
VGDTPRAQTSAPLAVARGVASADSRTAALLAARSVTHGWEEEDARFTSPGWRAALRGVLDGLGARFPKTADGPTEVGVAQFPETRVRLRLEGAPARPGVARDGHLVYAGGGGEGTDVIVTADAHEVEWLFVLGGHDSPRRFTWRTELPHGIARVTEDAQGGLRFDDHGGHPVLAMRPAYAIDARGVRRDARLTWDAATARLGVALDASDLAYPVLLDPAMTTEVAVWRTAATPGARTSSSIVYDAARANVVLFGGIGMGGQGGYLNDTWLWDGVGWDKASSPSSPPARDSALLAYDARHENVVLYGGDNNSVPLADTWTWDGANWIVGPSMGGPPARLGGSLAYDPISEQVLFFGGYGFDATHAPLHDTWAWDGHAWHALSPASAPRGGTIGTDTARGVVVAYYEGDATNAPQTWTWDGANWNRATPTASPPAVTTTPPHTLNLVADAAHGRLVLGIPGFGSTTWGWDGHTWTALPSILDGSEQVTYDATRARVVDVTAISSSDGEKLETRTWDGAASSWAVAMHPDLPLTRRDPGLAYDAVHGNIVMFSGRNPMNVLTDTWLWQAGWQEVATTGPTFDGVPSPMVFDRDRGTVLLFGGDTTAHPARDQTWSWSGSGWILAAPPNPIPAERPGAAMAYDEARHRVVLFGGTVGLSPPTPNAETWLWDGTRWTEAPAGPAPDPRSGHAMAYDAERGQVVLFGGCCGPNYAVFGDTWLWNGSAWTKAEPMGLPGGRTGAAMAYERVRKRVVLMGGGTEFGQWFQDTWSWDGTTWTQVATSESPQAREGAGMAFDEAQRRIILFGGGTFPNIALNDTWTLTTRAGACSTGADCDSGHCVDGVCCDAPACGTCAACNVTPGTCAPVLGAPDPDSCSGAQACDATGACKPAPGRACTGSGDCASGFCVDGVCCNAACGAACQACRRALTGMADGSCAPVLAGKARGADCKADAAATCKHDGTCDGAGACRNFVRGTACGGNDCAENRVVARVCDGLGSCGDSANGTDCSPYLVRERRVGRVVRERA